MSQQGVALGDQVFEPLVRCPSGNRRHGAFQARRGRRRRGREGAGDSGIVLDPAGAEQDKVAARGDRRLRPLGERAGSAMTAC